MTIQLDITKTHTLLRAYQALPQVTSFLKDRYFPTNGETDVFATESVLVDYKDNGKKVAPFVAPVVGGYEMTRDGFTTESFVPPLIAISRKLTIDDLKKRGFGEAIFSGLSPAERKTVITLNDLRELDERITRREELMSAETLINSKCVMRHITDATNPTSNMDEQTIQFYDSTLDANPYQYAPTVGWDETGAKIAQDIHAMVRMLVDKGLPAEELVVSGDVADVLINDPIIQKQLDNRRMEMGHFAPMELPNGAAHICTLNIMGKFIKVIAYTETYEDDDGTLKPYLPNGTAILTAPAVGRGLYGMVTQLEHVAGIEGGDFFSYPGRRVPLYRADFNNNNRKVVLSACPVLIPKVKGSWISAKVTGLTDSADTP